MDTNLQKKKYMKNNHSLKVKKIKKKKNNDIIEIQNICYHQPCNNSSSSYQQTNQIQILEDVRTNNPINNVQQLLLAYKYSINDDSLLFLLDSHLIKIF